jgi:hypothetical protein
MSVQLVLIFILVIIILYFIVGKFASSEGITGILDAKTITFVANKDMGINDEDVDSVNYSYSIWTYVNDWNYKYGQRKSIFQRKGLEVFFSPTQNDIIVKVDTYDPADNDMNTIPYECGISNIPIQKWINIIVSVQGKSIDIYVNGKLVKTCVMTNVPKSLQGDGVNLSMNNGFSGYTSKFFYMNQTVNPQKAWNIYKAGWGKRGIFNLTTYDVDVVVTKNGEVVL